MSYQKTVKKAQKGSDKAFQELIRMEKAKLYRMAYLYVKNENDALEIVQETVYKAYISIKKLKQTNYFSTWITRILINNALNHVRRDRHVVPIDEIERFRQAENPQLEDRLDLVDAIARLSEPYKTVIILRYYKDFTVRQIAETLECPEGTVKTNIHRATRQLKSDLREDCINE